MTMGVIGDWLKNKALPWIGNQVSSLANRYTGAGLTGAEKEANTFSAEQAQISREWDEKMYNQYNSPAALVSQYQSAGINPALMFGGQTPAAPQQSGSPTSVSPSSSFDLLSSLMQLAGLKANIERTRSETRKNNSESVGNEISNDYLAEQILQGLEKGRVDIDAVSAGIAKINSEIGLNSILADVYNQDIALKKSEVELNDLKKAFTVAETVLKTAQAKNLDYQNFYEEWKKAYRDEFGTTPDQPIWNAVVSAFGAIARKLGAYAGNIEERFNNLKLPDNLIW